jgi:alcohol dehydrogenase
MSDRFILDRDGFDVPGGKRIVFGPGKADTTGTIARTLGLKRVVLVTDAGVTKAGHADRVRRALEASGVEVFVFADTTPEPTTVDLDRCVALVKSVSSIDGYVAVGGGSSIDTAKGANLLVENGGRLQDYRGHDKAKHPLKPMIAIPTTAGTGSETQSFALIGEETGHRKIAVGNHSALPAVAILDPTLTLSAPASATANAGIDALVHSVETAVTRARSGWSTLFSREAFRLVTQHLPTVLSYPNDLEARGQLLLAACLAGLAIENSMLGAAHAAANPLSARYGTIHGQAVGITFLEVVRWNAEEPVAKHLYAELARSAGLALAKDSDDRALGVLLAELEALRLQAHIATAAQAGLTASDIPKLAQEAAGQWTAGFNPRPITAVDFEQLYARLLA